MTNTGWHSPEHLEGFLDELEKLVKRRKGHQGTAYVTLHPQAFKGLRKIGKFYLHIWQASGIKTKDQDHQRGHLGFYWCCSC